MNYSIMKWKNKISVLWNCLFWLIFTLFFGLLLQIIAVLAFDYFKPQDIVLYDNIIMDGILLFFSLTIVSSVMIDYYQSGGTSNMNATLKFLFYFIPIVIFLFCAFLFPIFYGKEIDEPKIDIEHIINAQIVVLIISCLYTISIKFNIFSTHQKIVYKASLVHLSIFQKIQIFFRNN